jgi:phage shock protein A
VRTQARVNKKIDKVQDKSLGQWEAALEEAERQILGHRRSITQLRGSVEIFKKKIASREPWPG